MNRIQVRKQIEEMLQHKFKYIFVKNVIDLNIIHLTFKMDSKSHNLQMTLQFEENYCDILCFLSPTVLNEKSETYLDVLKTVNCINWHIKAWGRYYIDDYYDIAYSLRLSYDVLEAMPGKYLEQIEAAVEYYADLFVLLVNVCNGKTSFEEAKQYINDMWDAIQ